MWQVGATCYSTKTAALEASASSQSGMVLSHGGAAHVVTVSAVGEDGVQYTLTPLIGGISSTVQVLQQPQPCNLLTAADALPIIWAIAGSWLVSFAVMSLLEARSNDS